MADATVGDYVHYKLSPSGIEGSCLLVEEGYSASDGTPMFTGHEDGRNGLRVVSLYGSDIVDVLVTRRAGCWNCGHGWTAVKPEDTDVLECPSCGEMLGAEVKP